MHISHHWPHWAPTPTVVAGFFAFAILLVAIISQPGSNDAGSRWTPYWVSSCYSVCSSWFALNVWHRNTASTIQALTGAPVIENDAVTKSMAMLIEAVKYGVPATGAAGAAAKGAHVYYHT